MKSLLDKPLRCFDWPEPKIPVGASRQVLRRAEFVMRIREIALDFPKAKRGQVRNAARRGWPAWEPV